MYAYRIRVVIASALAVALVSCSATTTAPTSLTSAPPATPAATGTAASTPSSSATASTRPLASDPRYGWIVPTSSAVNAFKVRRESDTAALLQLSGDHPTVSPDGRSVAYWGPAGDRRELHVASLRANTDRVVVTLGGGERGEAIGWATDSSGLAFQVDSRTIVGGGIDPPPAFSSIRTIDLGTARISEVLRRPSTRLLPFGWSRGRQLIAALVSSGPEGGPTSYLILHEDGTVREAPIGSDFCTHSTGMKLDGSGSTVLSIHPTRCSSGSGTLTGTSTVRVWPVDDPSKVATIELGAVFLHDAVFRPRTTDIVTSSQLGDTLAVDLWSGGVRRQLATATAKGALGVQFVPVIFRPSESVALIQYPANVAAGATTWSARLIDVATGDGVDVDLRRESPIASVVVVD